MYNRRYEKVFLMLRQETAGYAIGSRPPWGSCVMELKNGRGRLQLTVQGLKPLCYDVYVMAGEESVFCGQLCPEKKEGRCEWKWDFDPDALGKGKKAEDLHTVLVVAEGMSAPLTAYFREKRDWKQHFQPRQKEKTSAREVKTETVAEGQEEPVLPEKEATVSVAEDLSYHGSFQRLLAKFRRELDELEETGILTAEETEHIRNMGEGVQAQEKTEGWEEQKESFAENEERVPFGDGERWKRLTLEEMTLLSEIPLQWRKEFFFLLPWRKYHHLILRETEEGFWLGLPGRFNTQDAADAHAFGFHEFRSTEKDWGYWMAFLKRNG